MPFDGSDWSDRPSDLAILCDARMGIAEPNGWTQGKVGKGGTFCALGWVNHVAFDVDDMRRIAANYLFPALPWYMRIRLNRFNRCRAVVLFNDASQRRQSDVVALFDRAIVACWNGMEVVSDK